MQTTTWFLWIFERAPDAVDGNVAVAWPRAATVRTSTARLAHLPIFSTPYSLNGTPFVGKFLIDRR
jgi:hypothetical protein